MEEENNMNNVLDTIFAKVTNSMEKNTSLSVAAETVLSKILPSESASGQEYQVRYRCGSCGGGRGFVLAYYTIRRGRFQWTRRNCYRC